MADQRRRFLRDRRAPGRRGRTLSRSERLATLPEQRRDEDRQSSELGDNEGRRTQGLPAGEIGRQVPNAEKRCR